MKGTSGMKPRMAGEASPRASFRWALFIGVLLGLAFARRTEASIALVQSIGKATSSTTGTTISVTVPAAGVAAGHSVILTFTGNDVSGTYSASDSKGNLYSLDIQGTRSG